MVKVSVALKHKGFTLIELLVVLVILALTASLATFGFGRSNKQHLDNTAQQAQLWLQEIRDNAVFSSSVWGVKVQQQNMQAYVWQAGDTWLPAKNTEAFSVAEPLSLKVGLRTEGPQITLLPTGQLLPAVGIVLSDGEHQVKLTWQQAGQIQIVY